MEIIVIILTVLILAIIFNINYKKIKKINDDNSLDYITKKLPNNKEICKQILKNLDNESVEIEEQSDFKNSLYIVLSNKIVIGKMKLDSVRVQTIAHECVHSTQNRRILLSNFFLSTIFNVYFIISVVLTLFGIFNNTHLHLYIITMISLVCILIRNYLETDAMSKAEFIAKEYLATTDCSETEKQALASYYKELNKAGIPLVNYINFVKEITKPLIYTFFLF